MAIKTWLWRQVAYGKDWWCRCQLTQLLRKGERIGMHQCARRLAVCHWSCSAMLYALCASAPVPVLGVKAKLSSRASFSSLMDSLCCQRARNLQVANDLFADLRIRRCIWISFRLAFYKSATERYYLWSMLVCIYRFNKQNDAVLAWPLSGFAPVTYQSCQESSLWDALNLGQQRNGTHDWTLVERFE